MEGWDIYISTCPRPSFYLAWACTSTSPLRDLGSLPLRLVVILPFLFPSSVPFLPRRSSLHAPSLWSSPSFPPSLPPSFLSFLRFTPTRDKGPRTMGGLLLGGNTQDYQLTVPVSPRNCTVLRALALSVLFHANRSYRRFYIVFPSVRERVSLVFGLLWFTSCFRVDTGGWVIFLFLRREF